MKTDLEKSDELARAATPGPWFHGGWSGQCHDKHLHGRGLCKYQYTKNNSNEVSVDNESHVTIINHDDVKSKTAAFIAHHNPDYILKLNQRVRDLLERVAEFDEIRKSSKESYDNQDCICSDPNDESRCWFHMSEREKVQSAYLAGRLYSDESEIRRAEFDRVVGLLRSGFETTDKSAANYFADWLVEQQKGGER